MGMLRFRWVSFLRPWPRRRFFLCPVGWMLTLAGSARSTSDSAAHHALAKLEPLLGEAVAAPADAVPVTSAGASGRPARATSRRLS